MKELIILILTIFIAYRLFKSFKKNAAKTKEREQSVIKYSIEIEKNPLDPRAYFLRGTIYQGLGKRQLAINDYKKAIELNPANKSFNYEYSEHSDFKTFNNDVINLNLRSIQKNA
ncbi:MAG: tetratricopeptide repeat protein [Candidatus Shapirobacteria bacterium]